MKNIEDIITQAIEEAQAAECTLVAGTFGVDWDRDRKRWTFEDPFNKCCCALGAVLLKHQPNPVFNRLNGVDIAQTLECFLEKNCAFVDEFMLGFDTVSEEQFLKEYGDISESANLGLKIHQKYQPLFIEGQEEEEEEELDDEDFDSLPNYDDEDWEYGRA